MNKVQDCSSESLPAAYHKLNTFVLFHYSFPENILSLMSYLALLRGSIPRLHCSFVFSVDQRPCTSAFFSPLDIYIILSSVFICSGFHEPREFRLTSVAFACFGNNACLSERVCSHFVQFWVSVTAQPFQLTTCSQISLFRTWRTLLAIVLHSWTSIQFSVHALWSLIAQRQTS